MDYEHLSPADQAAAIRRRLAGLEGDHLNVSLDVDAAGPGGNPAQETRLAELEERIGVLRDRAKALERQPAKS